MQLGVWTLGENLRSLTDLERTLDRKFTQEHVLKFDFKKARERLALPEYQDARDVVGRIEKSSALIAEKDFVGHRQMILDAFAIVEARIADGARVRYVQEEPYEQAQELFAHLVGLAPELHNQLTVRMTARLACHVLTSPYGRPGYQSMTEQLAPILSKQTNGDPTEAYVLFRAAKLTHLLVDVIQNRKDFKDIATEELGFSPDDIFTNCLDSIFRFSLAAMRLRDRQIHQIAVKADCYCSELSSKYQSRIPELIEAARLAGNLQVEVFLIRSTLIDERKVYVGSATVDRIGVTDNRLYEIAAHQLKGEAPCRAIDTLTLIHNQNEMASAILGVVGKTLTELLSSYASLTRWRMLWTSPAKFLEELTEMRAFQFAISLRPFVTGLIGGLFNGPFGDFRGHKDLEYVKAAYDNETVMWRRVNRDPGRVIPYLITLAGRMPVNLVQPDDIALRRVVEKKLSKRAQPILARPVREDVSEGPGPESVLYEALLLLAASQNASDRPVQSWVLDLIDKGRLQVGRNIWENYLDGRELFPQGQRTWEYSEYSNHGTVRGEDVLAGVSVRPDPDRTEDLRLKYVKALNRSAH